jgi:hypothetical protein
VYYCLQTELPCASLVSNDLDSSFAWNFVSHDDLQRRIRKWLVKISF